MFTVVLARVGFGARVRRDQQAPPRHRDGYRRTELFLRFPLALPLSLLPAVLAAQGTLSVTVFNDQNGNGTRDAGERVIPRVVISNQRDVITTHGSGVARIERGPTGIVFVSLPNGYRSAGPSGARRRRRIRN